MKLRAICFDFGDTLADEATEVKDAGGVTLRAELIPGAADLVRTLHRRGYTLALVADGYAGTYTNVLGQHGIDHCFAAYAVSEIVGVEKPDARMFVAALDALAIPPAEYGAVMMVGNYLARDIRGANALGLISVWIDWAPRRPKTPAEPIEAPHYTIRTPLELLPIIAQIESGS
jgi:putative hydrolase of the HAD superfamily